MIAEQVKNILFQYGVRADNKQLYVEGTREDLSALSAVSKLFNVAATVWLYRDVVFDFEPSRALDTANLLQSLISLPNEQQPKHHYIRNLTISMPSGPRDASRRRLKRNVMESMIQLVSMLSNLRTFR